MKNGIEMDDEPNFYEMFDLEKNLLQYLNENIQFADTKVGLISAISLALIAVINDQVNNTIGTNKTIIMWIAISFLSISVILGMVAIFPRKTSDNRNLFFWGNIINFSSAKEYCKELNRKNYKSFSIMYSEQIYNLSKILASKYAFIKYSLIVFIPGVILYVVMIISQ